MKTIEEIRLENLRTLCAGFKSQRQFALHIKRTPEQVNQWLRDEGKAIVSTAAREIEEIMNKPRGWLDNDHCSKDETLIPKDKLIEWLKNIN